MRATDLATKLELAAEAIRSSDALLITAGAGMGVDSGLPDFRGKEGFWRAYPAIAKLGLRFEEMADPSWFERSPELAWAFYGHRLNIYRATAPHRGFGLLLEIAAQKANGFFVFTSNVDGHFQKAGFAPDRIVECHGSIHHLQCSQPCSGAIWDADPRPMSIAEPEFEAVPPLPACPACRALARPNVLMFGDHRWLPSRTASQQNRFSEWLAQLRERRSNVAIVELGAGTAIPTVRMISETVARSLDARLIRINPREAGVPAGAIGIPTGALEGIRKLSITPK